MLLSRFGRLSPLWAEDVVFAARGRMRRIVLGVRAALHRRVADLRESFDAAGWRLSERFPFRGRSGELDLAEPVEAAQRRPILPAEPLDAETQWSLATLPLAQAGRSMLAVSRLNAVAAERIDSAIYGLDRLIEELKPVMRRELPASLTASQLDSLGELDAAIAALLALARGEGSPVPLVRRRPHAA